MSGAVRSLRCLLLAALLCHVRHADSLDGDRPLPAANGTAPLAAGTGNDSARRAHKSPEDSSSDERKEPIAAGAAAARQVEQPVRLHPAADDTPPPARQSTGHAPPDYEKAGEDVVHLVKDGREFADNTLGFWHAFVASLSVIIVSELGDKTWFIAAILAMRHSRSTVFAGALAALAVMTVLSASLGWATQVIPRKLTFYVSTALFALFGLKMLKEGYDMSPDEGQEEYAEAENEVKKKEDEMARQYESGRMVDVEKGQGAGETRFSMGNVVKFVSNIFIESFTLTFLAEWGDRSQITTIILAAREDVTGVTLGGTLGHAICTGIAVVGGRLVAQRISVRTVTLIGGVVFIVFALSALFLSPE